MKNIALMVLLFLFTGCTSNPNGSTWSYTDFDKYDKNYMPFQVNKLKINQSKDEVVSILGDKYELIEAGPNYEVLSYQQWVSVMGPDYIEKILYIKIENNKLSHFKITNDTINLVPRSW